MDETLKNILIAINFVDLYQSMEEEFCNSGNNLEYIPSQQDMIELLESRHYRVKYFKAEKFFKIAEMVNGTLVQLNIAFPGSGHRVECILHVENKKNNLSDGGPFTLLVSRLTAYTQEAKKIPFKNKEQLEKIIEKVTFIYESVKKNF